YNFPPQVLIRPDGTVDIIKNELYYWRSKDSSNDLILYTGDSQPITPEADYEVADKVLEVAEKLGAKKVFTLAAYITGGFVKNPKVYGTATDSSAISDLKNHGVILMKEGSITGMNGLLVGLAKVRGMQGVSLLGETSGYIVDANASKAVLGVFAKMMNLEIDMTRLTERVKGTEAIVKTLDQLRRGQEAAPESRPRKDKDLGYIS
ncbi:MAG: proteasome assembly chaperone family protein, partial [Nitrososphaerales archaeon]